MNLSRDPDSLIPGSGIGKNARDSRDFPIPGFPGRNLTTVHARVQMFDLKLLNYKYLWSVQMFWKKKVLHSPLLCTQKSQKSENSIFWSTIHCAGPAMLPRHRDAPRPDLRTSLIIVWHKFHFVNIDSQCQSFPGIDGGEGKEDQKPRPQPPEYFQRSEADALEFFDHITEVETLDSKLFINGKVKIDLILLLEICKMGAIWREIQISSE